MQGTLHLSRELLDPDFRVSLSLSGVDFNLAPHPPCYEVAIDLRCESGVESRPEPMWPIPAPASHLSVPAWCPGVGVTFLYDAVVSADEQRNEDDAYDDLGARLKRPPSCEGREEVRASLRPLNVGELPHFGGSEKVANETLDLTDWCAVP